jgi:hypothetical protein
MFSNKDAAIDKSIDRTLIEKSLERFRQKSDGRGVTPAEFMSCCMELDNLQSRVGRERLASIAVQMVQREFGLTEKDLKFRARLINPFNERLEPIKAQRPQGDPPPTVVPDVEKRHICNAIIQGAAHAVQYRFIYDSEELAKLNPDLGVVSKRLMAAADWILFHTDPRNIDFSNLPPAGKMSLDFSTEPITIKAEAIHFPVLLHELAKGVVEALALHGLPSDRATRAQILAHADRPEHESVHLVAGSQLWPAINQALPEWRTPQERNLLLQRMFKLDTTRFNLFIKKAIEGDRDGARLLLRQ